MGQATVLLVEDNGLLREWLRNCLEGYGFCVAAPPSVSEAVHLAAARPFDVVITDWHLADGWDGFQVLAQVRKEHPQVPLVLISADADAELVHRAQCAGFDSVLQKPFPPCNIAATLHRLVKAAEEPR